MCTYSYFVEQYTS